MSERIPSNNNLSARISSVRLVYSDANNGQNVIPEKEELENIDFPTKLVWHLKEAEMLHEHTHLTQNGIGGDGFDSEAWDFIEIEEE